MDSPVISHRAEDASSSGDRIVDWIRDARQGSDSALGRVLEVNRKYLLMVANRSLDDDLKSKVGASDLVQDTFVEARRDFGQFKGQTDAELIDWLTGILANRLANNARRYVWTKKRAVKQEVNGAAGDVALEGLRDDSKTPCTAAIAREEQRRLQRAMDQLPVDAREILVWRTWQRASFGEIGDLMGCSADAARKRWAAAVQKLQKILAETR